MFVLPFSIAIVRETLAVGGRSLFPGQRKGVGTALMASVCPARPPPTVMVWEHDHRTR